MRMPTNQVVGLYPTRAAAASARGRLFWRDIAPDQVRILAPGAGRAAFEAQDAGDLQHHERLRDGLVAALLGALLAGFTLLALVSWGLLATGASPWPMTLGVMGLGALLGLPFGAWAGRPATGVPPPLPIDSALQTGQFVLLVRAHGDAQATMVRELLGPAEASAPARDA